MTEMELGQFQRRLASQFPDVPGVWIATVIDNAIEFIGRAGATPGDDEVETLVGQCLRMRTSIR